MRDFETIIFKVDGPVAFIVMNRPDKHNAISLQMLRELRDAFLQAEADDLINVMVLTGSSSKTFSSGIDLAGGILDEASGITESMLRDLVPLLECMEQCSKLIIGSVEGAAIGLGCSLALQCDLLVMSSNASLNLAFSKLGLIADGGVNWQLPKKVGYNRALQMVLEADVLDAKRCQELGIANKIVNEQDMSREVTRWARNLAGKATLPQGYTKQLMRSAMAGSSLLETVRSEARLQAVCADTRFFKKAYAGILGR